MAQLVRRFGKVWFPGGRYKELSLFLEGPFNKDPFLQIGV